MLAPEGRVIMISGANRGIGRAIALCLLDKGYSLSLGARDAAAIVIDGKAVMSHRYDATDAASNEAWVAATVARFGRIDGLVNNAGVALDAAIEDADEIAYDRMWEINVKGPLRMTRLALPHLRACGSGRIVNIASLSGKRILNDGAGYAMSKFAVMALSHATRRAGWDDGVRVTAICPGLVATDMTRNWTDVPRGDMIDPADLAELAATALALPNNAVVAELLVNSRYEPMF
jgi:NADP-dependent 3-hydroxy acid dehydrogenase YdfG